MLQICSPIPLHCNPTGIFAFWGHLDSPFGEIGQKQKQVKVKERKVSFSLLRSGSDVALIICTNILSADQIYSRQMDNTAYEKSIYAKNVVKEWKVQWPERDGKLHYNHLIQWENKLTCLQHKLKVEERTQSSRKCKVEACHLCHWELLWWAERDTRQRQMELPEAMWKWLM